MKSRGRRSQGCGISRARSCTQQTGTRGASPASLGNEADLSSFDLRHKRVGIIGNGSSAIQIVPNVRKLDGVNMWCFARSPTWISPTFGDMAMMKLGLDPADSNCT